MTLWTTLYCVHVLLLLPCFVRADPDCHPRREDVSTLVDDARANLDCDDAIVVWSGTSGRHMGSGTLLTRAGETVIYARVTLPMEQGIGSATSNDAVSPFFARGSHAIEMVEHNTGLALPHTPRRDPKRPQMLFWPFVSSASNCLRWSRAQLLHQADAWLDRAVCTAVWDICQWLLGCGHEGAVFAASQDIWAPFMKRYPITSLQCQINSERWFLGSAIATVIYYRDTQWREVLDTARSLLLNREEGPKWSLRDALPVCEMLVEDSPQIVFDRLREDILSLSNMIAECEDDAIEHLYREDTMRSIAVANACGLMRYSCIRQAGRSLGVHKEDDASVVLESFLALDMIFNRALILSGSYPAHCSSNAIVNAIRDLEGPSCEVRTNGVGTAALTTLYYEKRSLSTECVVRFSVVFAPLHAYGYKLRLRKVEDVWYVVHVACEWVS